MRDLKKNGVLQVTCYLALLTAASALLTLLIVFRQWGFVILFSMVWIYLFIVTYRYYRRNVKKLAFMFDAIDNADYSFKYTTENVSTDDYLINESLNRIAEIIFQARHDAQEKEKFYELILDSVNTGIIVIDEKGNVYQTNSEARRLLGLNVFTHTQQLLRVDEGLQKLIQNIRPGEKQQISYSNERGVIHLSVRASASKIRGSILRILAINDINNELDENELDSWIRLTRVLTHEIMNSVTPITSLSETLLSKENGRDPEIQAGLEAINTTGKGLIDFVENYRQFTHIPTPQPSLFYVKEFTERMKQLALHQMPSTSTTIYIDVKPEDLIVHADENLITRVVLNLLKNALQAIGSEPDGKVFIKAYCDASEAVFIEVSNNGPLIPIEEIDHIFIPFFTTKKEGSGIGLSISRQIMRLSGGTLTVRSDTKKHLTTFTLMFP